jgi:hypothetical protein
VHFPFELLICKVYFHIAGFIWRFSSADSIINKYHSNINYIFYLIKWILDLKSQHIYSSVKITCSVNHQLKTWCLSFPIHYCFIWLTKLWILKLDKYLKSKSSHNLQMLYVGIFIIVLYRCDHSASVNTLMESLFWAKHIPYFVSRIWIKSIKNTNKKWMGSKTRKETVLVTFHCCDKIPNKTT